MILKPSGSTCEFAPTWHFHVELRGLEPLTSACHSWRFRLARSATGRLPATPSQTQVRL